MCKPSLLIFTLKLDLKSEIIRSTWWAYNNYYLYFYIKINSIRFNQIKLCQNTYVRITFKAILGSRSSYLFFDGQAFNHCAFYLANI